MKESTTKDIMDEVIAGVSEKIAARLDIKEAKASIKNTISSQMQEERRLTLRAANAGMYDAVMDDFQQNHKDKMVNTPHNLPTISVHSNLTTLQIAKIIETAMKDAKAAMIAVIKAEVQKMVRESVSIHFSADDITEVKNKIKEEMKADIEKTLREELQEETAKGSKDDLKEEIKQELLQELRQEATLGRRLPDHPKKNT
jgi:ATP-dependent Lon protease